MFLCGKLKNDACMNFLEYMCEILRFNIYSNIVKKRLMETK